MNLPERRVEAEFEALMNRRAGVRRDASAGKLHAQEFIFHPGVV